MHEQARCGLGDDVVAGAVRPRTFAAEGCAIDIDDVGALAAEGLVVDAEAFGDIGAVVDHDHIAGAGEAADDVAAGGMVEVEGDGLLAAIEGLVGLRLTGQELPRQPPRLAVDRLDLDDLGAEVGEEHAAERPGDDLGEVQDSDPGERPGRRASRH